MGLAGILFGLAFLVWLAFRGWSILLLAPAAALLAAAPYRGAHRVFNVGSGIGRSVHAVAADIGRLIGKSRVTMVHKAARAADVPVNVLDIGLIRAELGWWPRVNWADGLRHTAEWIGSAPRS